MAFRIVADKSDDLPEGLRAHAKQEGDRWVVSSLPDGWGIEDVSGLKQTLSAERTQRKAAEKSLTAYEGIEDATAARQALEAMKAGSLKSSKEIDEFRKQLEEKVAADLAKKDQLTSGLTKQLREIMVDKAITEAIARENGNLKLLLPVVRGAVKAETTADGTLAVAVVDENGKELVSKAEGSTKPMSIPEFVSGLKSQAEFKAAFSGSGVGGSAANHASGGSGMSGQASTKLSSMDLLQRANSRL